MNGPDDYEQRCWQRIQAWNQEQPGPAARGFALATGPATKFVQQVIPTDALRKALELAHKAGRQLADQQWVLRQAGATNEAALEHLNLERRDALQARIQRRAMAAAGAGGVVFGVAGSLGLAADVLALLVLALRTIHRIGYCYGHNPAEDDRLAIGIFALASANTLLEKQQALAVLNSPSRAPEQLQDAAWRDGIERAAERELAKEAAVLSLNNLARQLGVNLGWRKAGGALPVIGAAVGGSVNAWYLYDLSKTAQFCFQERWLRQRYPDSFAGSLQTAG